MKLQTKHSLKLLNTLSIDSVADFYAEARDVESILSALDYAHEHALEVKVLGGGSNVVMSDHITGMVLKYVAKEYALISETDEYVHIKVDAGIEWHEFVLHTLKNGWYGLENLSYIPGTVGASPVQNIGAYGVEVKEYIVRVNGVYLDDGTPFSMEANECGFSYRESCFKQSLNGKTIITSVEFKLHKTPRVKTDYAPLNSMVLERGKPTPEELSTWVVDVRKSKLPDPLELPNAGSFFKNPVVLKNVFEALLLTYPNIPSYPQGDYVKLPAGWLIDQLGLKGHKFGPVMVHKNQALVLVNQGGTGLDVIAAAAEIKKRVLNQYGIELEQEPRLFS